MGERQAAEAAKRPAVHRAGGPLSQRQDHASRSHSGSNRRQSQRQGKVADKTTVGDAAPEARAHGMSVELNVATVEFPRRDLHLRRLSRLHRIRRKKRARARRLRCGGRRLRSRRQEGAGAAAHPEAARRARHSRASSSSTRSTAPSAGCARCSRYLQPAARTPLVLRQIPIWKDGIAIGFVDLALERAYRLSRAGAERSRRHAGGHTRSARRRPASPCWRGSPTMTTS